MRVILDTNVLMSALYFGGIPGRLLSAWAVKRFTLVLSPEIFEEYRRVGLELERQRSELEGLIEPVLALISTNATLVNARPWHRKCVTTLTMTSFLRALLHRERD